MAQWGLRTRQRASREDSWATRQTRSFGWQAGQNGTEAEPAKSTGVGVGVIRRQGPRPGPIVLTEGAWVWTRRIPVLSTDGTLTSSPTETQGPG